jgi:hypothetical protein
MSEIKEEWAKFIIGQALAEIKTKKDIPRVVAKVEGTALCVRPDLMKIFKELVALKRKTLRR